MGIRKRLLIVLLLLSPWSVTAGAQETLEVTPQEIPQESPEEIPQEIPQEIPGETPWFVEGTVLEKGTRRPLANISVVVNEQEDKYAMTDEAGTFVIELDAAGEYSLSAVGIGYEKPEAIRFEVSDDIPEADIRFYLEPAFLLPDVVVYADRNPDQVGKTTISGQELERVAGGAGDPLRAVQALPGIVVTNDASANPAIRGSAPGDNKYYIDFLPAGYLFHFGGLVSVVNADLVNDFSLYAAAYGAEYGDVLGGILDVNLREPRRDRLGGKVNISLIESDFLIEGPVNESQSFFFAARRSYFDLIVSDEGELDEDEGIEYRQFPTFHDYQGKYVWHTSADNTLSLQLNGASDKTELFVPDDAELALKDPDLAGDANYDQRYDAQGLVWSRRLSKTATNKFAAGHITNTIDQAAGAVGTATVTFDDYFLRERFTFEPFRHHALTLGGSYTYSAADFKLDFKDPRCSEFDPNCDFTSAERKQNADIIRLNMGDLYAKDRWRLAPPFTLILGGRFSYDDYLDEGFAEPRLGAEWRVGRRTLLTAGWGRYHQFPDELEVVDDFGNPDLSHQRAEHSVLGMEQALGDGWSWKTEAYYKSFEDLVVPEDSSRYLNEGSGRAYGLDLLVKKDLTARLSGWLALTNSRSERTNELTGETFLADYDQPVIAKLVLNYRFSNKWSFGAKWHYHSGSPYTPVIDAELRDPGDLDSGYLPIYGEINSERLSAYHRLDLRLDRDFRFDKWKLNTYVELINAYAQDNLAGYTYNADYSDRDPVYQLPLLLSFGVQAEF